MRRKPAGRKAGARRLKPYSGLRSDLSMATLVHEIRNPLTALSAMVQLFPKRWPEKAFREEFHSVMTREIERLSNLTNSFLDRSDRYADPKVDLAGVVDRTVQMMRPVFAKKKVQLKVDRRPVPFFPGDEDRVESLVLNLLRNALGMTKSGGKVRVHVFLMKPREQGARWIGLRVQDNGPGIATRYQKRVFDPYFSMRKDGVGLGLSVCRKVAEDHGGTIEILPTTKGALFQVCFPVVERS